MKERVPKPPEDTRSTKEIVALVERVFPGARLRAVLRRRPRPARGSRFLETLESGRRPAA